MVIFETTSVALVHACSSLGGAVSGMEANWDLQQLLSSAPML